MILAPIIAQIIYFAISRKREYLADASSALYTRYPEGLASALEKLQNNNTQVKKANKATAPMYISNPFYKKGMSVNDLFATHPPLADRIRILRAMSGASYADYEKSYEQVKGSRVVPASALAAEPAVAVRQASPQSPGRRSPGKNRPHPRDLRFDVAHEQLQDPYLRKLRYPLKIAAQL